MSKIHSLPSRIVIAAIILATGAACDKGTFGGGGGLPRQCAKPTIAAHCQTGIRTKCGVMEPIGHQWLCLLASDFASHEAATNAAILATRADCISDLWTSCEPTPDGLLPPLSFAPPAGYRAQSWGDAPCYQCVVDRCPQEAVDCGNDTLCVCMDQCQAAHPGIVGQLTPADCDCAPGDGSAYQALVACVQGPNGCVEACWPAASGGACGVCK